MNPELLRLWVFVGVFAAMAIAEAWLPKRTRRLTRFARWPGNLALILLGALALRLVVPLTSVQVALFAVEQDWGLTNWLGVPAAAAFAVGFIALDGAVWLQHLIFHRVPWLWRLHRVHHADFDLDVTSGLRFHPGEIVLSVLIKMAVIVLLGPSVLCVIAFEIVLNATAMFNHGNLALPRSLDRGLRWFVVTPDMHRVHHSVEPREMNRNYGFNLPWWDRLFGTYQAQPDAGHVGMRIGLAEEESSPTHRLGWMMVSPFRTPPAMATTIPPSISPSTPLIRSPIRPRDTPAGNDGDLTKT